MPLLSVKVDVTVSSFVLAVKLPVACVMVEVMVNDRAKETVPVYPELMFNTAMVPSNAVSTVESLVEVPLNVTVSALVGQVPPQFAQVLQLLSAPAPVQVMVAAETGCILQKKNKTKNKIVKNVIVLCATICVLGVFMFLPFRTDNNPENYNNEYYSTAKKKAIGWFLFDCIVLFSR